MNGPVIVSLSPRSGGNSDAAAALFARSLTGHGSLLYLRDHSMGPCNGCGACARSGVCEANGRDGAEELFSRLDSASGLVLTAPVYFYHLPSQAKAWIDRAQARYLSRLHGGRSVGASRPAYAVLIAARARGDHLFSGILPTLRYFLDALDFRLEGSVLVRGVDEAGDFSRNVQAVDDVRRLAESSGW